MSVWISESPRARLYTRTSSIRPCHHSSHVEFPPSRSGLADTSNGPVLASVRTFALLGIEAREVQVEADVESGGLPSFSLVGLPDPAVRESRERVRSALVNSGFRFPMHRITANLTPASTPRRVVNMTAIAAVEAQIRKAQR